LRDCPKQATTIVDAIELAFANGRQVIAHANGDVAVDGRLRAADADAGLVIARER
jgi:hypothetical protein